MAKPSIPYVSSSVRCNIFAPSIRTHTNWSHCKYFNPNKFSYPSPSEWGEGLAAVGSKGRGRDDADEVLCAVPDSCQHPPGPH